jgi:hypothetical protein
MESFIHLRIKHMELRYEHVVHCELLGKFLRTTKTKHI